MVRAKKATIAESKSGKQEEREMRTFGNIYIYIWLSVTGDHAVVHQHNNNSTATNRKMILQLVTMRLSTRK